jgi:molybdenum cofactor biosynthesis enzyme MoaA
MVRVVKRSRPRIVIPICVGSNPIMHPNPIDIYTMKHYCAMPFNHVSVGNNGDYEICCMHQVPTQHRQNINHASPDEWLQNSYLDEVKSAFAQDQPHPGCHSCWQQEATGAQSLRQVKANEYKIIGAKPQQSKVLNIEAAVGNLCNLSCVMCNEYNSSAILAENRQLGIAIVDQRDFSWSESAFENLQRILDYKPRVIHLRGGEPMYNKRILELIENFPSDKLNNTLLHLTTNATMWTPQWQQALSKFRAVRMMLSVDAVGDLGEYIRYPSKFDQVESNIKQIIGCKNINPVIHTTVQNLNIMYLGKVIQWAKNLNIHLMFDLLVRPDYFEITNLPPVLKQQAIEHLSAVLAQDLEPHIHSEIMAYKTALLASLQQPFDQLRWQRFVDNISRRDDVRGNTHRNFLKY